MPPRRLTRPSPAERGEQITVDTMPLPVWQRTWHDKQSQTVQALYAIAVATTPWVGVRITVHVDTSYHMVQSYATAEVFDGTAWHPTAGLHPVNMQAAADMGTYRKFDEDGAKIDAARLLEDTRLAYTFRAMGPAEYAERERVVVSHLPFDPGDVGLQLVEDVVLTEPEQRP